MVLKHPYVTEKAAMMLDAEGKLQFLVRKEATKDDIKRSIEEMFGENVVKVQTLMTMKEKKKAIVSFVNANAGEEILSRLGVM